MKEGCAFCHIDQEKTRVVADEPSIFVCLSNPALVPGHLLVVPKRHVELPWELTLDEKVARDNTIDKYQKMIYERLAKGCDVQQNLRPFIPEGRTKVDHVHWHLKPRNPNDELHLATQGQNALWQDLTPEYIERFKALYLD